MCSTALSKLEVNRSRHSFNVQSCFKLTRTYFAFDDRVSLLVGIIVNQLSPRMQQKLVLLIDEMIPCRYEKMTLS